MADARGTLTIADRALTRIARQVTLEVPGVAAEEASAGTVERTLGRGYPRVQLAAGRDPGARRGRGRDHLAGLGRARSPRACRRRCASELERLAGQDVDHVSVAVREVVRASAAARPVARVR